MLPAGQTSRRLATAYSRRASLSSASAAPMPPAATPTCRSISSSSAPWASTSGAMSRNSCCSSRMHRSTCATSSAATSCSAPAQGADCSPACSAASESSVQETMRLPQVYLTPPCPA
ncbi:hypothetical protein BS78_K282000 [Paspalum vaginatum]|uniref:Uncharacterized protein n=1 Tax=Paspalum vaginatum TaxID=158149 RepID=A0A9W8CEV5_9POAL|nr:hypothetical protein BS78_K282000 [Paspalum vaginatum]